MWAPFSTSDAHILAVVRYVAAIVHRPLPSLFVMLLFYYCMFHPQPFRQWVLRQPHRVIVAFGHSTFWKEFSGSTERLRNCEVDTIYV